MHLVRIIHWFNFYFTVSPLFNKLRLAISRINAANTNTPLAIIWLLFDGFEWWDITFDTVRFTIDCPVENGLRCCCLWILFPIWVYGAFAINESRIRNNLIFLFDDFLSSTAWSTSNWILSHALFYKGNFIGFSEGIQKYVTALTYDSDK